MKKIKNYIKLMRVKHYFKNMIVFLPLIFSNNLFNINNALTALIGFFSFSFIASSIYIINDIKDCEDDRKNPFKKNRPIASGKVSIKEAYVLMVLLIICSISLNFIINNNIIMAIGLELLYFFMNIMYSIKLKKVPIIDVCIIALGFIIRMLYGSNITSISISNWLYLTVMVGSFFMGFGKRRSELENQGTKSREVLKYYNKDFLDKFMYVCLGLAIVFYSLWAIDIETINKIGNNYMIYTIPLIFIILMKYSFDVESFQFGDPVDIVFKDKFLLLLVLIFGISVLLILYI